MCCNSIDLSDLTNFPNFYTKEKCWLSHGLDKVTELEFSTRSRAPEPSAKSNLPRPSAESRAPGAERRAPSACFRRASSLPRVLLQLGKEGVM